MVAPASSFRSCFFEYFYISKRKSVYPAGNLCLILIMFKKIIAFVICGIAVMLPWRLRCLYSEALGWVTQFFYFNYFSILKIILSELEKAKIEGRKNEN